MTRTEPGETIEAGETESVTLSRHLGRLGALSAAVALLLGWLVAHTDVLFADGLRYVTQAQAMDRGAANEGVLKAVDHPVYPLAIAVMHRALALGNGPDAWQFAAQVASVLAGVLLVVPLYLTTRELFGDAAAVPGVLLVYAAPMTGHVFADTLSESTFLLFWTWGLWATIRFLKSGAFGWVPMVVGCSALAYLTRPEGLLLPAALMTALALSPSWVARGLGRRGLAVLGVLVIGSAGLVGPYIALKGGLGTKPSIARLLGTAPRSPAHAVERQRPLEPGQTPARTFALAGKAVAKAITEAVTWPLVPLAVLGLVLGVRISWQGGTVRPWTLLGVIGVASWLALMRLHATGGYCTPRHALILSLLLIPAAALGLDRLLGLAGRLAGPMPALKRMGWVLALGGIVLSRTPEVLAPVNEGLGGYRQAGQWIAATTSNANADAEERVVDVTGWSQFYGERPGYTFADLTSAAGDPRARWVVVREAHLKGPWEYCQRLRSLVDGLEPVEVFRGAAGRRPTKVYLFDRRPHLAQSAKPSVRR